MNQRDLEALLIDRVRFVPPDPAAEVLRELEQELAGLLLSTVQAVWDPNAHRLVVHIGPPKHGEAMTVVVGPAPVTVHAGGSTPPDPRLRAEEDAVLLALCNAFSPLSLPQFHQRTKIRVVDLEAAVIRLVERGALRKVPIPGKITFYDLRASVIGGEDSPVVDRRPLHGRDQPPPGFDVGRLSPALRKTIETSGVWGPNALAQAWAIVDEESEDDCDRNTPRGG